MEDNRQWHCNLCGHEQPISDGNVCTSCHSDLLLYGNIVELQEEAPEEAPRANTAQTEKPRVETPRTEAPKYTPPPAYANERADTAQTEKPRIETPRVEVRKYNVPPAYVRERVDNTQTEKPRIETPRVEVKKYTPPPAYTRERTDNAQAENPRVETPKYTPPQVNKQTPQYTPPQVNQQTPQYTPPTYVTQNAVAQYQAKKLKRIKLILIATAAVALIIIAIVVIASLMDSSSGGSSGGGGGGGNGRGNYELTNVDFTIPNALYATESDGDEIIIMFEGQTCECSLSYNIQGSYSGSLPSGRISSSDSDLIEANGMTITAKKSTAQTDSVTLRMELEGTYVSKKVEVVGFDSKEYRDALFADDDTFDLSSASGTFAKVSTRVTVESVDGIDNCYRSVLLADGVKCDWTDESYTEHGITSVLNLTVDLTQMDAPNGVLAIILVWHDENGNESPDYDGEVTRYYFIYGTK